MQVMEKKKNRAKYSFQEIRGKKGFEMKWKEAD